MEYRNEENQHPHNSIHRRDKIRENDEKYFQKETSVNLSDLQKIKGLTLKGLKER